MKTFKQITREMADSSGLKKIIEVYEEVAATKMQAIRDETVIARQYYDGLVVVSQQIGADFARISEGKAAKAAVFVSANAGLYGDIVSKTFSLFAGAVQKEEVDIYVVGSVGEDLMRTRMPGRAFKTFAMPDDVIEEAKFDVIARQLTGYKEIEVYYGRFNNLVNQESAVAKISGDLLGTYQTAVGQKKNVKLILHYLYEPDVYEVSRFFGEEIMMAGMEQMFRESQLARYASRLMHLDAAITAIEEKLVAYGLEKLKVKKRLYDKKQRGIVVGILTKGGF